MKITVNEQEYELSTKLRTIQKLENHFNMGIDSIFNMLGNAKTSELVTMLHIAAAMEKGDTTLKDALLDNWDYSDLMIAVKELLCQMLFSGTAEEQERKIGKFTYDEKAKNDIREMLGLPLKPVAGETEASIGKE